MPDHKAALKPKTVPAPNLGTNIKPGFADKFWHQYLRRPYTLHVVDYNPETGIDKPVIVFLHGLASSSANWDPLIPLLRDSYHCVSIDLVGFGDSPKPQWYRYTMDEHIQDIHKTIRSLGLKQSFTLVGHSLGSLIATRYAKLHENRVNRLVLLSPPVYAPPDTILDRYARQRTSMYLRAYKYLRNHKHVTAENVVRLSRIIPPMKFLVLNSATWLPFIRTLEQCVENQTIIKDIVKVRAPIDIFYGIFDEVVVPYNVKQLGIVPGVRLHPLKINHVIGKRYAEAVADVLA